MNKAFKKTLTKKRTSRQTKLELAICHILQTKDWIYSCNFITDYKDVQVMWGDKNEKIQIKTYNGDIVMGDLLPKVLEIELLSKKRRYENITLYGSDYIYITEEELITYYEQKNLGELIK